MFGSKIAVVIPSCFVRMYYAYHSDAALTALLTSVERPNSDCHFDTSRHNSKLIIISYSNMLKKPVQSERTKQLKSEIKQMKAGPEYKPSKERLLRDQMKCFLARQDLVDQSYDKLFKVLAPESQGFTKTDLVEFMGYLQESAQLNKKTVEEHNIEKFTKECNIKDIKN